MSSGFTVNVAEVRGHSRTVAACSAEVDGARGSAQPVSPNAYGLIGSFFASAVLSACGDVLEGIGRVAAAVDEVRQGLEAVADDYEAIDLGNAAALSGRTGR